MYAMNFQKRFTDLEGQPNAVYKNGENGDTMYYHNNAPSMEIRISHMSVIRRWKQLSRLQRSLVYLALATFAFLIILLKSTVPIDNEYSPVKQSHLTQDNNRSENLVIEPAEKSVILTQKPVAFNTDFVEKPKFTGPTNDRQRAVAASFQHAWRGYRDHAWGHDNLKPISGSYFNWFSLGLTIVDSIDTAYIMNLKEEFDEGRNWVQEQLIFTKNRDVNFFEVTIRVLGALLTNYHFTEDNMFLEKARDLGERLMGAFSSPSGIPYSDVNLATMQAHAPEWSTFSSTAEVTTVQLEFRELSRATGEPAFEEAAARVSEKIHVLPKKSGLVPIFINPKTGQFLPHATITLGARGDSYYEYLLKQWLQTGKAINYLLEDYLQAIEGVRDHLAKRSSPNKRLFIGELTSGAESFNPKMDHLTCFLPGTLALGAANGLPSWHMTMAEELIHTCYLTYAAHPTFLAPEITHFNLASPTSDMYTKAADAHSLLRPEFVESLWYMYQLTGNHTYQEWGWQVFQAYEKYAKVENGYTSLSNVRSVKPPPKDMMESFFLSETLKYLYLLFSDDRYLIDLKKYVMNSEAHPLPVHDY